MTHLHFRAFFHLRPLAASCNAPFFRKKVSVGRGHFVIFLRNKVPLNENMKDDPPAFLGVITFGVMCNVVQCTVFPGKRYPRSFLKFFSDFLRFSDL